MANFHRGHGNMPLLNETPLEEDIRIPHGRPVPDEFSDSDFEDDFETGNRKTDTSALEARNGKDIQGIPWERLNITRKSCREERLKQYKNYESLSRSREEIEKDYKDVVKGQSFFDFQYNTRLVKPTIVHFQLRSLLWSTSKHDVYFMRNNSFVHWSSLLRRQKEVVNMARPLEPTMKYPGSVGQALSRVQICAVAVKDNLMVAGGLQGELVCKHLNKPEIAFCTKLTTGRNATTNTVDIFQAPNGSLKLMAANNDAQVRVLDAQSFVNLNCFTFPWSVNNISASPDGKMITVVGDDPECLIADSQSGKVVGNLKGHLDYSFASAWHPNGQVVATGNQDTTCRLWDIRNLSRSFAVLKGRIGAIRTIQFSSDGQFLAIGEPADFVHVFLTDSDYVSCQEIDLFSEIAGISFSPDTQALFIGIADRTYGSLLEFNRRHYNHYVDYL
ncbi:unnamed protein product [Cuscuta epithymum]|uniref:Transducin/WD40 repeat-like superfamily protein n=1 Tax=Cuscuta epithymum TaxID=186058 RepID=A0AAV0GKV7_9ASTE|nr:unnamed protein product [Cuscuta epithymum]